MDTCDVACRKRTGRHADAKGVCICRRRRLIDVSSISGIWIRRTREAVRS